MKKKRFYLLEQDITIMVKEEIFIIPDHIKEIGNTVEAETNVIINNHKKIEDLIEGIKVKV